MSKSVAYQNGEEAIEAARLIQAFMHFRIEEARVNTAAHAYRPEAVASDLGLRPLH